jgi:hypothetical protein
MSRKPSPGRPFLDKIAVTIPVPEDHWIQATDNIFELSHSDSRLTLQRERYDELHFKLYNFSWTFRISPLNPPIAYIQILPRKNNISYMRIEWNPAKSGTGFFRILINLFSAHVPCLEDSAQALSITRLDIAVDVTGLRVRDIYAFSKSAKTTDRPYFDGPNNSLSGFYLGTKKSTRQLLIYDKNLEEFGGDSVIVHHPSGQRSKRLIRSRTRIELRVHNLGVLTSLQLLHNQFDGYSLIDANALRTMHERNVFQGFSTICQSLGAQRALSMYEARTRARLRKVLDTDCAFEWYCPLGWWLAGIEQLRAELSTNPINA